MEDNSLQAQYRLIERISVYASVSNSLPFSLKAVSGNEFEIGLDAKALADSMTKNSFKTWFQLGQLCELISLEALAIHQKPEFEIFYSLATASGKIASFKLSEISSNVSEDDRYLSSQLCMPPSKLVSVGSEKPLPDEQINWLTKQINQSRSLVFSYLNKIPKSLYESFIEFEEVASNSSKLVSQNSASKIKPRKPEFYKRIVSYGMTKIQRRTIEKQISESTGFGFLGLSKSEPEDQVALGRCYLRMQVYLNSYGFRVQPLSFSSLVNEKYEKTQKQLQHETMMTESFVPVWGFRIGRAKNSPAKDKALSPYIEDVLFK